MLQRARDLPAKAGARLRLTVTLWRRSLALVVVAAPRQALTMAVLMLLQAFVPVGTLWASRGVVNAAARALGVAGSAAGGPTQFPLSLWITVAVSLTVAQQIMAPLFQTTQEAAGELLTVHVNGQLIATANRWHGLARFEDPTFADHLTTARNRATRGPVDLIAYGGRFGQSLVTIVAMAMALWRLHPLAPLLLVLAHVPQALQENTFGQTMANTLHVQSAETRRLSNYRDAVLSPIAAKDVRLFDLGAFFLGMYTATFGRASAEIMALRRTLIGRMAPAQVLSGAASAAVYLYAVHRLLAGGLSLGDLVLFGGALQQLQSALWIAGFDVGFFAMIFTWLPSLFLVLDAEPDLVLPPPDHAVPAPRPIRSGLALDHVSFRYPGTTVDTLRDVSFRLRPGERLALVGRNGAGKTTLVKLLARLYDPTEGRITLDGIDLRDYDLDDLRRQIGVVFQDYVCFQLTAQENIGLGDVIRLDHLADVEAAAHKGGAATLIDGWPKGYATQLGAQFGGVNLSGGQWQRVALSRAFMRDAQVLILDEPTAALDAQAEYDVYRRFTELTAGASTVLISHRFSTVRMADRICYLEDGRLVEEGSHDELLRLNGGYAHLYRLQAELYQ